MQRSAPTNVSQLVDRAHALHHAGRLAEAEALYREILSTQPAHADAMHGYGLLLLASGHAGSALALLAQACTVRPRDAGLCFHRAEAARALGLAEAETWYRKALELQPNLAEAAINLGGMLAEGGRFTEAEQAFAYGAHLRPQQADCLINLGLAQREQGKLAEAAATLERASRMAPADIDLLAMLADLQHRLGLNVKACESFARLAALAPDNAHWHYALAFTLNTLGRLDEAEAALAATLARAPAHAGAHMLRGVIAVTRGEVEAAEALFRKSIALDPTFAAAHYNLGNALLQQSRLREALDPLAQCLRLDPGFVPARWAQAMAQVPIVPERAEDVAPARARLDAELGALARWLAANPQADAADAVGSQTLFYLAYQERDNRELLARYGALCAQAMERWSAQRPRANAVRPVRTRVRVGVVGKHFFDHSVWHAIVRGWFEQLDAGKFELHAYHLGSERDACTAQAQGRAARFVQGPGELAFWADTIHADAPDVLIYPEIGMDHMTVRLASLRLAPLQMASWGHPDTTGLPTIDAYLSAEAFEPPDAQRHYTERLIALPGIGTFFRPEDVRAETPDFSALGLDPSAPLLVSAGTPFKYAPEHDGAYVELAQRLPDAQIALFRYHVTHLAQTLETRLRAAFNAAGMDLDAHLRSIPWQSKGAFRGLLAHADAFLDTLGFSGFNTAVHALEASAPVLTQAGRFMRGRLAAGVLDCAGLGETIAEDRAAWLDLAERLVRDRAFNRGLRARIALQRGRLYERREALQSLENYWR